MDDTKTDEVKTGLPRKLEIELLDKSIKELQAKIAGETDRTQQAILFSKMGGLKDKLAHLQDTAEVSKPNAPTEPVNPEEQLKSTVDQNIIESQKSTSFRTAMPQYGPSQGQSSESSEKMTTVFDPVKGVIKVPVERSDEPERKEHVGQNARDVVAGLNDYYRINPYRAWLFDYLDIAKGMFTGEMPELAFDSGNSVPEALANGFDNGRYSIRNGGGMFKREEIDSSRPSAGIVKGIVREVTIDNVKRQFLAKTVQVSGAARFLPAAGGMAAGVGIVWGQAQQFLEFIDDPVEAGKSFLRRQLFSLVGRIPGVGNFFPSFGSLGFGGSAASTAAASGVSSGVTGITLGAEGAGTAAAAGFGELIIGLLAPGAVAVGGPEIAAVGLIILVGLLIWFLLGSNLNSALPLPVQAGEEEMGVPAPTFTVNKTADVPVDANGQYKLPNSSAKKDITYTITVTPTGGNQITINKIEDEAIAYGDFKPNTVSTRHQIVNNALTETITVDMSQIPNSRLINTVYVTATTQGNTPASQTHTAQAIITIGNPIDSPPFGFPLTGPISTLDVEDVPNGDGTTHKHCGEVYEGSSTCPLGGLDIAARGDVVSTLDGFVVASGFNKRLGGYVFVRSKSAAYYVAFIHMDHPAVNKDDEIKRGMIIGKVYTGYPPGCAQNPSQDGCLEASSGIHLHYQVLLGGQSLMFADSKNAGSCLKADGSANAIEPEVPNKTDGISPSWVANQLGCTRPSSTPTPTPTNIQ